MKAQKGNKILNLFYFLLVCVSEFKAGSKIFHLLKIYCYCSEIYIREIHTYRKRL